MGVNYGGNRVRFLQPVRSGKRVRGRFTLLAFDEKRPGQWQQTTEFTVEIEGEDKPAMIAEWISQIFVCTNDRHASEGWHLMPLETPASAGEIGRAHV